MNPNRQLVATTAALLSAGLGACGRVGAGERSPALPARIASIGGFHTPEPVRHDPEQDVYFVSNIDGNPSAKDGSAFISRLSPDGEVKDLRWIDGSRPGVKLNAPNGIALDASGWFWLAPMGSDAVQRWLPGTAPAAAARGPGGFDGIEPLPDGRILVTSWSDSAVHVLQGERIEPLIRGVPSPADLGVDTRRGRVIIPLLQENRVEIWTLPRGGR